MFIKTNLNLATIYKREAKLPIMSVQLETELRPSHYAFSVVSYATMNIAPTRGLNCSGPVVFGAVSWSK